MNYVNNQSAHPEPARYDSAIARRAEGLTANGLPARSRFGGGRSLPYALV